MGKRFAVSFEVEVDEEVIEKFELTPANMTEDIYELVTENVVDENHVFDVKVVAL